ncbi:molybdenum cofactor biosynthesis protein MoaE [Alkalicoccus luteus]|uniref:Molybdopterin synthase catalytic subunit n=1 Tax=Alkalicoccus luteus TaxID=1237094 RepID=A0A969TV38_9BACI|nr:molybdenum cofactor biosynthesis protein MoaE [Alkalicoccus luteus]NJP37596.1 molybdenum cofactor biosynthesis protein MoaE [Alkalicoccus luteus]
MEQKRYRVTEEPLDSGAIIQRVTDKNAGAVTVFIGTVREMTKGKRTLSLTYEAYVPMAEKKLAQIGAEIEEKWPGTITSIEHRIGSLAISDAAVVIAVSSPHRDASFKGSRFAIERIKEIVPIWKKEHWEDGSTWIGDQLETTSYAEGAPEEDKS